jgi:hypothetical protein
VRLGDTLPAEGTGIDMEEGSSDRQEQPLRPPAVVLALEDTGYPQKWLCP